MTYQQNHPYGTTLLARKKPVNIEKWGSDHVGYVDVLDATCIDQEDHCPPYHCTQDATRSSTENEPPEKGGNPSSSTSTSTSTSATTTPIHMLIASFRDQLCPRTLHNAFSHAEHPHRLYIRVLEQTEANSDKIDDASCWDRYCTEYNADCDTFAPNVRMVQMDSTKSKGPTDARSKLSAMVVWDYLHRNDDNHNEKDNETNNRLDFAPVHLNDYCMQTDSHMDFSDNFDTELVLMHHRTRNDYAVLSTYVADISQNNQDIRTVPNLCMVEFTSTIRNWGTKECVNLVVPKLTNAMWGAGLSFHRCHAEIVVPVDPYLDGVFDGEEGSRGIRFFTHGYDVYTPDRVLVTHDYHGHQSNPVVHTWGRGIHNKHTNHQNEHNSPITDRWREEIESHRPHIGVLGVGRLNAMLAIGMDEPTAQQQHAEPLRQSRYGLGTKRTLAQVKEFTGIDLNNRNMVQNKCGNLKWVPFVESGQGGGSRSAATTTEYDYGVSDFLQRPMYVMDGTTTDDQRKPTTAGATSNKVPLAATRLTSAQAIGAVEEGPFPSVIVVVEWSIGIVLLYMALHRYATPKKKSTKHRS